MTSRESGGSERAVYVYSSADGITEDELADMCVGYFDAEAAKYDAFDGGVQRRGTYLRSIDDYVIRKLQSLPSCGAILSFGCGTGRREEYIAGALDPRPSVVGVEPAAEMARKARDRGLHVIDSMRAVTAPPRGSVDVVLCLYSFIHLASVRARRDALHSFAEVLQPQGCLLLDVFNLHDVHEWPSKLADGGSGDPPPLHGPTRGDVIYRRAGHDAVSFMHYFTVSEITTLLEDAGFIITELVGVGHGAAPGRVGVPLDEGCIFIACKVARQELPRGAAVRTT